MSTEPTDPPSPDAAPAEPHEAASTDESPTPPPAPMSRGKIRRARGRLVDERDEALYHLGGLAHDLHRRGDMDRAVLGQRAERIDDIDEQIQLLDWRLETLERERRARRSGGPIEAGNCVNCRTAFHAEAQFCARCGVPLGPTSDPSGLTMEIDGLPPV